MIFELKSANYKRQSTLPARPTRNSKDMTMHEDQSEPAGRGFWVPFSIWLAIGIIVYFLAGIGLWTVVEWFLGE